MRKTIFTLLFILSLASAVNAKTYNNLWIPDTLSGTELNLTIKDTIK
jgi:hypothetical protein